MRLHVDTWDPGYGAALAAEDGVAGGRPRRPTEATVDVGVERAEAAWEPLAPGPAVRAPGVVHFVDGVRRVDARLWIDDPDVGGPPMLGLCASYAAGAVTCDLGAGSADVTVVEVERAVFTSKPAPPPLGAHDRIEYPPVVLSSADPTVLDQGLQAKLRDLEITVAAKARDASAPGGRTTGPDDLLVVDGPLRGRTGLARTLGYVKTHQTRYLPPALDAVVSRLGPGQRTPVFRLGTSWHRLTWYLRLPVAPDAAPWSGVVRVECAPELPVARAVTLADVSAVTLPRFASRPFKDPRAPQNLVPIGGLERRLRALLGDARLLHRCLRLAAARANDAR